MISTKKCKKWRDNIPTIIGVINSETILAKGLSILVLICLMHEDHQMNGYKGMERKYK